MVHLDTGDYLIDDEVLVERKTIGDFVASLVDGRLLPQTARLAVRRVRACEPYRELIAEALGRGRNAMAIWQDLVDVTSSPAVAKRKVVVATADDQVICFA